MDHSLNNPDCPTYEELTSPEYDTSRAEALVILLEDAIAVTVRKWSEMHRELMLDLTNAERREFDETALDMDHMIDRPILAVGDALDVDLDWKESTGPATDPPTEVE